VSGVPMKEIHRERQETWSDIRHCLLDRRFVRSEIAGKAVDRPTISCSHAGASRRKVAIYRL